MCFDLDIKTVDFSFHQKKCYCAVEKLCKHVLNCYIDYAINLFLANLALHVENTPFFKKNKIYTLFFECNVMIKMKISLCRIYFEK